MFYLAKLESRLECQTKGMDGGRNGSIWLLVVGGQDVLLSVWLNEFSRAGCAEPVHSSSIPLIELNVDVT